MKVNEQKLNEFVGKAVNDLAAGYGGVMVGLGHKLGPLPGDGRCGAAKFSRGGESIGLRGALRS